MREDNANHLNLLSVFHYVAGGITAVLSLMPVLHLVMGIVMMSGDLFDYSNEPPPPILGLMIVIMSGAFIVLGLALSICMVIAGKKIKARKCRIYCMVIAGIECTLMPYGTVLGVFTLIVLNRKTVKELFDLKSGNAPEEIISKPEKTDGIIR